jgi:hypothetical protein
MTQNLCLIQEINKIQNDYYENVKKNIFFKKSQKIESAEHIINKIPLDELIQCSIYTIPNTNKLFFDYTIFKMYASPSNYNNIIHYMIMKVREVVHSYGNFEMHMNMKTFSVSATERYIDIIKLFCNECCINNEMFIQSLLQMYIYNTPSGLNTITSIIMKILTPEIRSKITHYLKDESKIRLNNLFTTAIPQRSI